MVNTHQTIDQLYELYLIVGENDFTAKDIPAKYRYLILKLESGGYLIKSGVIKCWYYDRNKTYQQYRISAKYLKLFSTSCI